MPRPVQVKNHVVAARPVGHRLDCGVADHQIDHHDHRAELLGEVGALVHRFERPGRHVQVVALDLAGSRLRAIDRFHAVQKPVAPVHEGLRVDVLVILGEVEAAAQRLVHHAAVVLARQSQLRLHGRTQQRAAELVESLALDHDAGGGSRVGLDVGGREAHVLQAQRFQRLEAEHVADDRGAQVGDRARLEQRQIVGDVGEVLPGRARHRIDLVGLGAITLAGGQSVGPHDRPRRRRGFARHGRSRFRRLHAFLRGDAKQHQYVAVPRYVVRLPIAHLRVLEDARPVARGAGLGLRLTQCGGVVHWLGTLAGCGRGAIVAAGFH